MNKSLKFLLFLIIFFLNFGCSEKISYSGKIIDKNININSFLNKNQLISKLGNPSYIDHLENQYFYFTEKQITKNFFDKKILEKKLYTFKFDENDNIISKITINLKNVEEIKYLKETTKNNLIERGFIEKVFGGIGRQPTTTSTF